MKSSRLYIAVDTHRRKALIVTRCSAAELHRSYPETSPVTDDRTVSMMGLSDDKMTSASVVVST